MRGVADGVLIMFDIVFLLMLENGLFGMELDAINGEFSVLKGGNIQLAFVFHLINGSDLVIFS